jgi:hypothetical protein
LSLPFVFVSFLYVLPLNFRFVTSLAFSSLMAFSLYQHFSHLPQSPFGDELHENRFHLPTIQSDPDNI